MQIQKSPFPTDFLRNNPEFIIRTSPDRAEERRIDRHFIIARLDSGNIKISTAHGRYVFEVKDDADREREWEMVPGGDTPDKILESLEQKMVHNTRINRHYTVSAWIYNDKVRLRFTAKEGLTEDFLNIDAEGHIDMDELTLIGTMRGRTRVPKENYRIMAQYLLEDGTLTPAMYLDDNGGTVKAGTAMLAAWLGKPDIPRADETLGLKACANQTLTARLLYAESVNGNTGVVKISDPVTLINAKVEEADFLNNRPDWVTADEDRKMWRLRTIEIHGQDIDDTVRTDTETEQYMYISNLTAEDIRIEIAVDAKDETGHFHNGYIRTEIAAGTIARIPCGWQAVKDTGELHDMRERPVRWTVTADDGSETKIARSFTLRPRPYGAVTALLLNRCRLYESLVFEETAEETQTEGDAVETAEGTGYLARKRRDTVTLRTGKRTAKEIALLRDALEQQDNLLLDADGRHARRMTFAPDTLKLRDSGQDLVEAEIKAILGERIDRLATNNPWDVPIGHMSDLQEAFTTIGK